MRNTPELLLIFPPFWDTSSPYLSLPTLASWLRKSGIDVEAIDLNLDHASRLLTVDAMEESLSAAGRVLHEWPASRAEDERLEFADNLALCEKVWRAAGSQLLAPFRPGSLPPSTIDDYTKLRRKLGWAFGIVSAPFYPIRLKVDGLVGTDALSRLSAVCDLAASRSGAPGLTHTEDFAREQARRGIPLVGISVAGPSQLVPALLLARIFKAHSPATFVCLGGPQIPYIVDSLRQYDRPFDWVDAFVPGEGELPLTELCMAIREGRDAATVRGLLIRRDGVVMTGKPDRVDVGQLAPPDFDGFEPWRYIGNTGCLPLTFARGCSWSRCTFCTQHICFDGYRAMSADQVGDHLTAVVKRYKLRTLAINDENLTPQRLREVARVVTARCPGVGWQALARLAPPLADPRLARELANSGCLMLSMGLESADQGVLDLNRKGISAKKVPDILRTIHDAGIWVNLFLIFGLPGETPDSACGTIAFALENRHFVDSFSPTVFRVEKGSPIAEEPEKFGITLDSTPSDHCDSELPVTNTVWLNKPEAMVCLETLIKDLAGAPQCPIEQADLNGQFVLQTMAEMGIDSLRAEMRQRASATGNASDLLEQQGEAYREWWTSVNARPSNDPENRVILALPDRGTFFTLTPDELLLLRLRALGLPVNMIEKSFGSLLTDEVGRAGISWGITASVLLLLSSRLLQESCAFALPLEVLRLHRQGAESALAAG